MVRDFDELIKNWWATMGPCRFFGPLDGFNVDFWGSAPLKILWNFSFLSYRPESSFFGKPGSRAFQIS